MKFDFQTLALIAGAVAVVFWPVIKDAIKAFRASGGIGETHAAPAVRSIGNHHVMNVEDCPCVEPQETIPDKNKSEWVAQTMEIRNYVEKKRLSKGVDACDVLIAEIVSGKADARPKIIAKKKGA